MKSINTKTHPNVKWKAQIYDKIIVFDTLLTIGNIFRTILNKT